MTRILALAALVLTVALAVLSPAGATDLTSIGRLDPGDLGDLIDPLAAEVATANPRNLGATLGKEHSGYPGRSKLEVMIVALDFAIARQVYCLAYAEPEPGWEGKTPQELQALVGRKNRRVRDLLATINSEKKNRPNLGIVLAPESGAQPQVRRPSSEYPWRVEITRLPFLYGWRDPSWPHFPAVDQLPPGPAGWQSIQRTVIHELAHKASHAKPNANHGPVWQEMERFLWHLWSERCDVLADFGDADATKYPTDLFSNPKGLFLRKQGEAYLYGANLVLRKAREKHLGAHHLETDVAWLGTTRDRPSVDREGDARKPRDLFDDGIVGNAFAGSLRATISVDRAAPELAKEGSFLVLRGWIDWNGRDGFNTKPREHLVWTGVAAPGGGGVPWARLSGRKRTEPPHSVIIDPSQWPAGVSTRDIVLTFRTGAKKPGGFARFRLYYFANKNAFQKAEFLPSGRAPYGEVEDYWLSAEEKDGDGDVVREAGDLIARLDPSDDFRRHDSGRATNGPASSDIRDANVYVTASGGGAWTIDCPTFFEGGCPSRVLNLEMELYEPVPQKPRADFASWHFVLDLDGRRSTGHPGDRPPVGVFPALGIDLWADAIWDGRHFRLALFLGGRNIASLTHTPGLLTVSRKGARSVLFEIPLEPLEEVLSEIYGRTFGIDEEAIEWVAVTNRAKGLFELEDPPSDFFPDALYVPE